MAVFRSHLCFGSCLLLVCILHGRMAQALGSLLPTWQIRMEFPPPDSSLAVENISGINQQIEDLSIISVSSSYSVSRPPSPLPFPFAFQINKQVLSKPQKEQSHQSQLTCGPLPSPAPPRTVPVSLTGVHPGTTLSHRCSY